jgi:hypothetical protein
LTSTTLLLIGLLFTGCASVPEDYPRTTSVAYQDYLDTSLGQLFEEVAVQHPGESGFDLVRYGHRAFTTRVALTELAEQSLDLQYYIWEDDATGRILAERLIRAADRGSGFAFWSMTSTSAGVMRPLPRSMLTRTSRFASSIPLPGAIHASSTSSSTWIGSITACTTRP